MGIPQVTGTCIQTKPSTVYTCGNIVKMVKMKKGAGLKERSRDYSSVIEGLLAWQLQGPRLNPHYWATNEHIDRHLKKIICIALCFKYHTSWLFTKQCGAYNVNSCCSLGAVGTAKKSDTLIDSPWKVTLNAK